MDLLRQIQSDILDPNTEISVILRKARVLAAQLESSELGTWASSELDGYKSIEALPDYRLLSTSVAGQWTNNFHMLNNRGVPMYQIEDDDIKKMLSTYPVYDGIRTVENLSAELGDKMLFLSPDAVAVVNKYVVEGGYGYATLHYTLTPHDFDQLLDTVRNRLLDFVLQMDKEWKEEEDPPPQEIVRELVHVTILNHPKGGPVTVFDQRGQNVQYQFNAAGDINFREVSSVSELSTQLEKLRAEIKTAKTANELPDEGAVEAEYHILQAKKEVEVKEPNEGNILRHLGKAKDLLSDLGAAAGLIQALAQAAEVVSRLL